MTLKELDAAEFRRQLAGLSDQTGGEEFDTDAYKELSTKLVLLLYIAFNGRKLDAKTIHSRIESAINKGLADCDGEDISQFVNTALNHVMANINTVTSQPDCVDIQSELYELQPRQAVCLLQYLEKHTMPAIAWANQRYKSKKEEYAAQKAMLEIEQAKKEEMEH